PDRDRPIGRARHPGMAGGPAPDPGRSAKWRRVRGMSEWLIKALVLCFLAWMAWSFLQPRYAFEIRVDGGYARGRKGKVTAAFVSRLTEACQSGGVVRGWVGGVQRGRQTALRFSRDFSPGLRQRLRSEWQVSG